MISFIAVSVYFPEVEVYHCEASPRLNINVQESAYQ
jgi:hypothetical protein